MSVMPVLHTERYSENGDAMLVGKVVESLEIADDKEAITLKFADAEPVTLRTEGDCCSHSWIEHISGVKQLVGRPILAIEDVAMPEGTWDREEYELTQYYGLRIKSDVGALFIEYRNTSNGYYGGDIYVETRPYGDPPVWHPLTDDL